jgi:FkbM family methyltransferase
MSLKTNAIDHDAVEALKQQGFAITRRKNTRRYFHRLALEATSIIDVGVNRGTPWLYQTYRDRPLLLVDPRAEAIEETRKKFNKLNITSACCAVGSYNGSASLNILARGGLSGIDRRAESAEVVEQRTVPVRRLDQLVDEHKMQPPFGIKIDTEGHEMEVLKGAIGILPETAFIISEVSVKKRFVDGYRFSDVIAFMRSFNFELLDTLTQRSKPISFIDCLFVKYDNPIFSV